MYVPLFAFADESAAVVPDSSSKCQQPRMSSAGSTQFGDGRTTVIVLVSDAITTPVARPSGCTPSSRWRDGAFSWNSTYIQPRPWSSVSSA